MRASGASCRIVCPHCQGQTLMVTPEEATVLINASAREIYRWVETGQVPYGEGRERTLLVCAESILRLAIKRSQAE
jgi:hypothetical protein